MGQVYKTRVYRDRATVRAAGFYGVMTGDDRCMGGLLRGMARDDGCLTAGDRGSVCIVSAESVTTAVAYVNHHSYGHREYVGFFL